MAKRVQIIRHNTGGADAFTGLNGELTVDTTAKELRLHDSLTEGGIAIARKDLANVASATSSIAGKMTAAHVVELVAATANIASEIVNRIADVDAEEVRALAAEGVLRGNVDAEAVTRAADDVTLQGNIDAEETARIAGDAGLQSQITSNDGDITALQAQVDAIIGTIYPVGAIYIGTTSTNPNTLFGLGTWVAVGDQQTLVQQGTFSAGSSGGSKDAVNVSHGHTDTFAVAFGGTHAHNVQGISASGANSGFDFGSSGDNDDKFTDIAGSHAHTLTGAVNASGVSGIDANMPPYLAVYMWKRTA